MTTNTSTPRGSSRPPGHPHPRRRAMRAPSRRSLLAARGGGRRSSNLRSAILTRRPLRPRPDGRRVGATYLRNNLGKKSVALDLKHPEGRPSSRLVPRFDVVGENFAGQSRSGWPGVRDPAPPTRASSTSRSRIRQSGRLPVHVVSACTRIAEAMSGLYEYKRRDEPQVDPPERSATSAPPLCGDRRARGPPPSRSDRPGPVRRRRDVRCHDRDGRHRPLHVVDGSEDEATGPRHLRRLSRARRLLRRTSGARAPPRRDRACRRASRMALGRALRDPPGLARPPRGRRPSRGRGVGRGQDEVEGPSRYVRGIAAGPSNSAADLIEDPHGSHRMLQRTLPDADEPLPSSESDQAFGIPGARGRRRPTLGEHTDEVLRAELGQRTTTSAGSAPAE